MSKGPFVDYFIKPVGDRIIGSFTDFTILSQKTLIVLIHVNYRLEKDAKTYEHAKRSQQRSSRTYTVYSESGDGTLQSCTSAIPKMDFAFGSKNHTDVNQVAPLAVGVSINPILIIEIYFTEEPLH